MSDTDAEPEASEDPTPRRPRDLQVTRRRRSGLLTLVLVVAAAAAFAVWYLNHPGDLPTSSSRVSASGTAGQPVYVGMFTAPDDFGRTLDLSGVKVHTTADVDVGLTVTPLLCRDGTLGVTTDPTAFCTQLLDPAGEQFGAGDAIVVEIQADSAVAARIDPVRLGFQEGLQWGTLTAGTGADVQIFGGSAGSSGSSSESPSPSESPSESPSGSQPDPSSSSSSSSGSTSGSPSSGDA